MLQDLLIHLADGDGWDTAIGAPVDEKMVTAATQPLSDAGWKHTVDGRWIRWTSPGGDAGVQFDAFAAQHAESEPGHLDHLGRPRPGPAHLGHHRVPAHPEFAAGRPLRNLSPTRPARARPQPGPEHRTRLATSAPAAPAVTAGRPASRSR